MPRRARPAIDPRILVGDCRERLPELADSSIDAMVTDPPSGTHYGDQAWDRFGSDDENGSATREALASYRCFLTETFREACRVLKPGAYAVVWAFPRTCHHTMTALEDAGFDVRDVITHHFATGNPKSRCPGEWVDRSPSADAAEWGTFVATERKRARMSSEALADRLGSGVTALRVAEWERGLRLPTSRERMRLTKLFRPEGYVTSAAREWEGWGTALKPATEFWVLARKPLENGNLGDNTLRWGTGAMPVHAVRTGVDGSLGRGRPLADQPGHDARTGVRDRRRDQGEDPRANGPVPRVGRLGWCQQLGPGQRGQPGGRPDPEHGDGAGVEL